MNDSSLTVDNTTNTSADSPTEQKSLVRSAEQQEHIDRISLDMAAGYLDVLIEDVESFHQLKPTILIYAQEGTFPIFYNHVNPNFQEALSEIKHATRNLHVFFYMGYYVVSDNEIMLIKFDNGVFRTSLVEYDDNRKISRQTKKIFFLDSIDSDFKLTELHTICNM